MPNPFNFFIRYNTFYNSHFNICLFYFAITNTEHKFASVAADQQNILQTLKVQVKIERFSTKRKVNVQGHREDFTWVSTYVFLAQIQ